MHAQCVNAKKKAQFGVIAQRADISARPQSRIGCKRKIFRNESIAELT